MKFNKNPENIKNMFNLISEKYDFVNNLMSLGTQYKIKKDCVKRLGIKSMDNILDLCCGTGDFCEIIKKEHPNAEILGADFSENMLEIAREKNPCISYVQCDAVNLPFKDNSFDVVIVGFGLRNILNAEKAVEEIYRVLKPNGKFLHLDFGKKNIFSKIFDILTVFLSRIFSENFLAYEYLIRSKNEFPNPEDLIKDFEKKGFKYLYRQDYIFGVISSQVMKK